MKSSGDLVVMVLEISWCISAFHSIPEQSDLVVCHVNTS